MKKTIIYGGAFNPPTIAHEIILKACSDYARKINADVWVMPSGNRFDKEIFSDRNTRIEYVKAMIRDVSVNDIKIEIITNELDRNKVTETFDTIQELSDKYPDRSFVWVFGADSVNTMPDWDNGQWMLDNLDMLIIERTGCLMNMIAKKAAILNVVTPNVSSTEVRRRLSVGEDLDDLVGKSVKKILK